VQESSTLSEESNEDAVRMVESIYACKFSDDSDVPLSEKILDNSAGYKATKKIGNLTNNTGEKSQSKAKAAKKIDDSSNKARQTSEKSQTKARNETVVVQENDSSVSVKDTVGKVFVNIDVASPSVQGTVGEVFINIDDSSPSVLDTVDELVVQKSNLSKVVEEKVVEEDLSDLVDSMYSIAFSLSHSGTLGVPRRIPLS
jgi:hypothetical protein